MKKYTTIEFNIVALGKEDAIMSSPVDVDTQWNDSWNTGTLSL